MHSQPKSNQKHSVEAQESPDFAASEEQPINLAHAYANDVHTFLSWEAPGRPFKHRGKEFFINGFLIMMAVEVILFLFSQYLLMMVVFSFVFLAFALASVPPRLFHYKISSQGILIDKSFFIWDELYDFYFFTHHGQETIHITTKSFFPGELTITLSDDVGIEDVKAILLHYLPFREYVEPTWLEKAGDWLERNFPLERHAR
jgi:hypothetical protein